LHAWLTAATADAAVAALPAFKVFWGLDGEFLFVNHRNNQTPQRNKPNLTTSDSTPQTPSLAWRLWWAAAAIARTRDSPPSLRRQKEVSSAAQKTASTAWLHVCSSNR
jgi:hypothetical protein